MPPFSASDAALEGFQVIRAQWRIVLGWCLFSLLSFVALVVVAIILIAMTTLAVSGRETADAAGSVIGVLVLLLGWIAIPGVVVTALRRMMLRPSQAPGLYYLRISGDEWRVFGLWLVVLALGAVLMILGFLGLQQLDQINGVAVKLGVPLFLAFLTWLALRLSLAGSSTFAKQRLSFVESWHLTRGRCWPLLGMSLLAFCLLALILIVIFIVTAVVQAAIGGFHTLAPVSLSDRQALADRPGAYVFGLIAELIFLPVYLVIGFAPFVAAYKALSAEPQA